MKPSVIVGASAAIVLGVIAATDPVLALFLALSGAAAAVLSGRFFDIGLRVLVALAPLLGLRLFFPPFREGFFARFFPDGIDLRGADALALALIASFAALLLWRQMIGRPWPFRLPGVGFFLIFLGSGLISVQHADVRLLSFKYVLYPILFSFLAYVAFPLQIIRTRQTLARLLRISFFVALAAAAGGALSLLILPGAGLFRRATLLGWGSFYPFGSNHNLLAELLVATFPYGFLLARATRRPLRAFWYRVAAAGMIAVALLTFARTAWIALAIQGALFIFLAYRHRLRQLLRPAAIAFLIFLPLLAYMIFYSRNPEVSGSLTARVALSSYAFYLFSEHPIIGSGTGTFVERLGGAKEFTATFGDPLDAHGFIQKIGAEQGILGLAAFAALLLWILLFLFRSWKLAPAAAAGDKQLLLMMFLSVVGSVTYQLFNTSYYNAKLWLPVGLSITATVIARSITTKQSRRSAGLLRFARNDE